MARGSPTSVIRMKLHTEPDTRIANSCTATHVPPESLIALTLGKIECHLRNGNWAIAQRVLAHAEQEFAASLSAPARTPQQWLDAHLAEFGLPVRIVNVLEEAGHDTMRRALAFISSGAFIPNFAYLQAEQVWEAAASKGIKFRRSKVAEFEVAKKRSEQKTKLRSRMLSKVAARKSPRSAAEIAKDRNDWGTGKKAVGSY